MKATLYSALTACALVLAPALKADQADCLKVADAVKKQVEADTDNILKIVEKQAATGPSCSCEVVKAAILAAEADKNLVGQIVATAIEAAQSRWTSSPPAQLR